MSKKYFVFILISLFILSFAVSSFAQMKCMGDSSGGHKHNSQDTTTQTSRKKTIEIGNKICPVLNEKIDKKTKVTYEYEGKIYNLCCSACIDEFKKDPQKYIKKVEEELKAASGEEEKEEKEMTHQMPLGR